MFHPPGPHKKDDYCFALGTFGGFLRGGCCLEASWGTSTKSAFGCFWGITTLTKVAGRASVLCLPLPQWDLFPRGTAVLRACSPARCGIALPLELGEPLADGRAGLERLTLGERCFVRVNQQPGKRRRGSLRKECLNLDKSWVFLGIWNHALFCNQPTALQVSRGKQSCCLKKKKSKYNVLQLFQNHSLHRYFSS